MRRILMDHARERCAQTRKRISIPIDEGYYVSSGTNEDLVAIDDALKELVEIDPDKAKIVELRFYR